MKTLKPCHSIVVSKPHGTATAFVLLPLVRFLPVMVSDSLQIGYINSQCLQALPLKEKEELIREQGKESG